MEIKRNGFSILVDTSNNSITIYDPEFGSNSVRVGLFLGREGGITGDVSFGNVFMTLSAKDLQDLLDGLDPDREIHINTKTFKVSHLDNSEPIFTVQRDGISVAIFMTPEQYKSLINTLLFARRLIELGDVEKIIREAKKGV